MSEWKEIQLRDISSDISYGYTASAETENVGPKFLRITDITSGRVNWDTVPHCKISDKDFEKYKLGIGDIVIARTGATTGCNTIIKEDVNAVYASYLIRFQIDKNIADPFFIGYILQSNNFQDYVDAIAGGSAQPGANAQQFADYEFKLPPLPEQRAIAEVLSSLDDKIDLLHRQNKTLEQLAETLFRQWFVEEADESWEVGTLGEVITIYDSKRIPLSSGEREKMKVGKLYPYYGAATIMDYVNDYIFDGEYILMGEDGTVQTPDGFPILQLPTGKFWVNNHAHIFQAKPPYSNFIIYIFLKQTNISGIVTGAVQPKINQEALKGIDFPFPPIEKTNKFITITNEFWNKIKSNTQQIRTLTQLRDTLLPKLMSGEVRVKSEELIVKSEKLKVKNE